MVVSCLYALGSECMPVGLHREHVVRCLQSCPLCRELFGQTVPVCASQTNWLLESIVLPHCMLDQI